jgi:hypothetical protein
MPFYQPDNRPKDREGLDADIQAFLDGGGKITRVPNAKKMKTIRRRNAATKRVAEKEGHETVFDFGEF